MSKCTHFQIKLQIVNAYKSIIRKDFDVFMNYGFKTSMFHCDK